jgi:hypothetical protein
MQRAGGCLGSEPARGAWIADRMVNAPRRNFSALTTHLYEVTMASDYWNAGVSDYVAAFQVTFGRMDGSAIHPLPPLCW